MAKKLKINCALCDARNLTPEALEGYDGVIINAANILTNAASRAVLIKANVKLNCANVIDVAEEDVKIVEANGSYEITGTLAPQERLALMVNGKLQIAPGTQEILKQYVSIIVNGTVFYPESLGSYLGMMTVNGNVAVYPDGAILLKRSAVIDRTFSLRAKNSLYWAEKRLVMVDPNLEARLLKEKGARFSSKEAIVSESKVESLAELIDDRTDITIVPDGTAVITDDVTLDAAVVRRYGKRLYVLGDLKVEDGAEDAIAQLEYLTVKGDVTVVKPLYERLMAVANEISGDVSVRKGRYLEDRDSVLISSWLLESEADGVSVCDCETVVLEPELTRDLIVSKLAISDCERVICSQEQMSAVCLVCNEVEEITTGKNDDAEKNNDAEKTEDSEQSDQRTFNVAKFVF